MSCEHEQNLIGRATRILNEGRGPRATIDELLTDLAALRLHLHAEAGRLIRQARHRGVDGRIQAPVGQRASSDRQEPFEGKRLPEQLDSLGERRVRLSSLITRLRALRGSTLR